MQSLAAEADPKRNSSSRPQTQRQTPKRNNISGGSPPQRQTPKRNSRSSGSPAQRQHAMKTPFGTLDQDSGVLELKPFPCKDTYRATFRDALQSYIDWCGYDEDAFWDPEADDDKDHPVELSLGDAKPVLRRFVRRLLKNKKLKLKGADEFYAIMTRRINNRYLRKNA